MNKHVLLLLEILWLGMAVFALGAGIHKTYQQGFAESYLFFIIVVISVLMYFYRRNLRKKHHTKK